EPPRLSSVRCRARRGPSRSSSRNDREAVLGFALLIEYLYAFQPPCLRRTIQLPQVAQRTLAGTGDRSHRLYQRPVGVILPVLAALMGSQKHLPASLSSAVLGFK